MSGSSATCMQAGLYPVLSKNTGIDLPPGAGILLEDCEISTIQNALHKVLNTRESELVDEIKKIQSASAELFSRQNFSKNYAAFLDEVISGKPAN
jgi:hypothetical protein